MAHRTLEYGEYNADPLVSNSIAEREVSTPRLHCRPNIEDDGPWGKREVMTGFGTEIRALRSNEELFEGLGIAKRNAALIFLREDAR